MPEKKSKWSRLRSLNGAQWLVILQSPWVLLVTWARLHRTGYQRTLEHIHRLPGSLTQPQQQARVAKDTALALKVAIRGGPWWPRCLTRSLALARLLKRRGIPFTIRIGVEGEAASSPESKAVAFNAHAWVEHAGIVLNDRQDIASQFSAFDTGSDPV